MRPTETVLLLTLLSLAPVLAPSRVLAGPRPQSFFCVEDVRPGMKGTGRTVMKGTRIETFHAEVIGVLKNTSPGRDLVLCRLSGLDLDKTGVIAGMSGSPVYINDKLLGAVAYAWPNGKPDVHGGPIAGITPFCQMHGFVEAFERRDLAEQDRPTRVGLRQPLRIGDRDFTSVTIASNQAPPPPNRADELWLTPLRTPLAATGFTPHSLKLLRERCGGGLVPMQGGSASARVVEEARNATLEPGGPMAVALIRGDFDLSGIGTVTHIEGKRVYGWGHPFMGLGGCDFPLLTGYIHTVYPRQTVSFKMGSPLKVVGVVNADVSTCIAGWLDRKADLLPVRMTVSLDKGKSRTFNVEIARQRSLLPTLVFTALTNSVDMEGELPEEMTADLRVRIEVEGQEPIVIEDTFSGFSGGRAPQALYGPVASLVALLTQNPFKALRIQRIECRTVIHPGRRTAEIEAVELSSDSYAPGDTVRASVFLRPFKGEPFRLPVSLKLPADLPEGSYSATVCDDPYSARLALRDNPTLGNPSSIPQIMEAVNLQTRARRTSLVLRVPVAASGVAVNNRALPHLPPSMVQILGNSRRTGAQTLRHALVGRRATDWVIVGSESVSFTVSKLARHSTTASR